MGKIQIVVGKWKFCFPIKPIKSGVCACGNYRSVENEEEILVYYLYLITESGHILKSPCCNDVKYKLMEKNLLFGGNTLFYDGKYKITGNIISHQVYAIPIMVLLLINSTF